MWLRRILKQIPGVRENYHGARLVWQTAYLRWTRSPRQFNDEFHLKHWVDFESPPERDRHRRILELAGAHANLAESTVFELGCADGVFTCDLCQQCASVTAADLSPIACSRTRERCRYANLEVLEFDITCQDLPRVYDVLLAMDILDLIRGQRPLNDSLRRLAAALPPGGLLVLSDWRVPQLVRSSIWARWYAENGEKVVDKVLRLPWFDLLHREYHPLSGDDIPPSYYAHVIALFRRTDKMIA